jgi:hypothetical protein
MVVLPAAHDPQGKCVMTGLTPEQRSQRARLAAHARWAKEDPTPAAEHAQAGLVARFDREAREASRARTARAGAR